MPAPLSQPSPVPSFHPTTTPIKKATTFKPSAFKKPSPKAAFGANTNKMNESPTDHMFTSSLPSSTVKGSNSSKNSSKAVTMKKQRALNPSNKSRLRQTKQDAGANLVNSPDMWEKKGTEEKKKRRQKPFPRKKLWKFTLDSHDLLPESVPDPITPGDPSARKNNRSSRIHRNTTKRLSTFKSKGGTGGLTLIDETFLAEEASPRRDINVAQAKNEYRAQLANCVKIRSQMPHNLLSSSSSSSSSSSESEEDENPNVSPADLMFVAQSAETMMIGGQQRTTYNPNRKRQTLISKKNVELDEDFEFRNLSPEKILEDMRLSHHGGRKAKDFRAAHAMSMRRKLSSYHRNGIPSSIKGRSGRRGSKFDGASFMKSRRMSKSLGLDTSSLRGLHGLISESDTAKYLIGEEESESSEEEILTNDTQTDHYHSYHLYGVYEDLHKPRVAGRPGSARTVYLRTCEEELTAPLPIFDHIQQTANGLVDMNLSRYGIGDKATMALAAFLKQCPLKVNSLEVSNNSILNRGMTALIKAISGHTMMKILDISENSPKRSSIESIKSLFLQPDPVKLIDLRLSGCAIGDRNMKILAEGIAESVTLTTLKLDRNNLTRCGKEIAYFLHENLYITDLDLSWNQLRNEEAAAVARSLEGNEVLTTINLAWNHFGYDPAIFALAKFLTESYCLNSLDISFNKVKERGSICMADALKQNSNLKSLNMDGNPVGPTGGRALLKMIATEGNMRNISMESCNFEMPDDGPIPFDVNEPNGFYKLDLSVPYDRMIATSLQELAYTQGGECWRGEKLDGEFFDFPETDPYAWQVPHEGILELAYVSNKPLENSEMNADQFKVLKSQISRSDKEDDRRATSLVKQLSDTFAFNSSQVGEMIDEFENSNSKVVVATRLFTQVSDTDNAERLLAKLNQLERKQVEKKLGQFYYFNSKNPTGHYRLNLSIEFERLVAVRVAEVNNTEKLVQRLEGKLDLTQKGNWENLRNETFDGEKFVYTSSWKIPHRGIFEFDYVSTVRPESEAEPMEEDLFEEFVKDLITLEGKTEINQEELREIFDAFDEDLGGTIDVEELGMILKSLGQIMTKKEVQELFDSMDDDGSNSIEFEEFQELWEGILKRVMEQDRLITLRRKSTQHFVGAEQIQKMLAYFEKPLERVELFVIFFCRLVDEENMHLALNCLSQEEKDAVMHRLGALNLFNPFQPDSKYSLDLSQHDTHLLAEILIKLGIGEHGKTLHEETYNGFAFTLPVAWINSVPRKGVYEVVFHTPDDGLAIANKGGRKTVASNLNSLNPRSSKFASGGAKQFAGSDLGDFGIRSPNNPSPLNLPNDGWGTTETAGPSLNAEGRPTFSLGVGGTLGNFQRPSRRETNAGNIKLRRLVAEELLGWEFMADEDEQDVENQHDAISRRRATHMKEEERGGTRRGRSPTVRGGEGGEYGEDSESDDDGGKGEQKRRRTKMNTAERWKNIEKKQQILKLQQQQQLNEQRKREARELGEAEKAMQKESEAGSATASPIPPKRGTRGSRDPMQGGKSPLMAARQARGAAGGDSGHYLFPASGARVLWLSLSRVV
ncbi:hypothetical protein TL16_g00716 [Triparma laevis f. inornata]|uniref:EF-hand domain-containing protein n=1 Tax=Triparma laevis f. inornata TaxID=1714386 RepID=A0A9W6ZDF1_9STRA|nr:hypothetical protein TL16_g00716 [Triparma laevis f. inornata]